MVAAILWFECNNAKLRLQNLGKAGLQNHFLGGLPYFIQLQLDFYVMFII